MTGLHTPLFRIAIELAEAQKARVASLVQEILEAEKVVAQKKGALQLARSAVDRIDGFEPEIGGDIQCPYCWVVRGVRSNAIPIPSDTAADLFRCKTCDAEFSTD